MNSLQAFVGRALKYRNYAFIGVFLLIASQSSSIQNYNLNGADPVAVKIPTDFSHCLDQFAKGVSPQIAKDTPHRALCFDGFAILYSPKTKIPIFAAEVISRESLNKAKEQKRTNHFFEDARLPYAERAHLSDYKGSGYDRGHNAPAGNRSSPESMAQSFSLANMMPQAPINNQKIWSGIEQATRKYAMRAQGNVYVITGSIYDPKRCPVTDEDKNPPIFDKATCSIGPGKVAVPAYLYKLVYDPASNRAWAHWVENKNNATLGNPISYSELVSRTGIEFLPSGL